MAAYILDKWGKQPTSFDLADMFESETSFRKQFKLQLGNPNSTLHEEIKKNWNNYSLIDGNTFLKSVMVENLPASVEYGLLPLIADFTARHLNYDQHSKYVCNQDHVHAHVREDEGFDLPVYYAICFVGILYSTAIDNKVDINNVAFQLGTMRSIYSSW